MRTHSLHFMSTIYKNDYDTRFLSFHNQVQFVFVFLKIKKIIRSSLTKFYSSLKGISFDKNNLNANK